MKSSRRAPYIRVSNTSDMAEFRTVGPVPMTCAVKPGSADGERGRDPYSSVAHRFPMLGVDHDARSETVGHNPASDSARCRSLQRFDYLEPIVVRQPDIKDQVHVISGGIDIGDK